MKKWIATLLTALMLVGGSAVHADAAQNRYPTGTIAVDPSSDVRLGGVVSYDVTTSKMFGGYYPMVSTECLQNGQTVYGDLTFPTDSVKLGGDSSLWLQIGNVYPTYCYATLVVIRWKQGIEQVVQIDATALPVIPADGTVA